VIPAPSGVHFSDIHGMVSLDMAHSFGLNAPDDDDDDDGDDDDDDDDDDDNDTRCNIINDRLVPICVSCERFEDVGSLATVIRLLPANKISINTR